MRKAIALGLMIALWATSLAEAQMAASGSAVILPDPRSLPAPGMGYPTNPGMPYWNQVPGNLPTPVPPRAAPPATAGGVRRTSLGSEEMPAGNTGIEAHDTLIKSGNFEAAFSSSAPCGDEGCNDCCQSCCCRPVWFGSLYAIALTRNLPNPVFIGASTLDNFNQVVKTSDANPGWVAGGGFTFGRAFCGGPAIQANLWATGPLNAFNFTTLPGDSLTSPIDWFGVQVGGAPASDFFDNAQAYLLKRRNEFYNVEINLISLPVFVPGRRLALNWLAGVGYFQFNEGLLWGSVANGFNFGDDGGTHEAYVNVNVRNSLVGGQLGAIANWFCRPNLSFFALPKFGVYNNFMHENFQLYRGDGVSTYNINSNKNNISFIGALDLGVNWAFAPNWSLFGGYRLMAITGVALSDVQIPHFMIDQPEIRSIKSNNDLVLNGFFLGSQFRF